MLNSATMTAPVAVLDTLGSLLEAEQNSVFRYMGDGSPYLSRATAEVRRPLAEMVRSSERRCSELASFIDSLGGYTSTRGLVPEEQYLAYLSLKFLLPKLVDAKKLIIQRYENALRAIGKSSPDAAALVQRHIDEHNAELDTLEKAAASVAPQASKPA